MSRRRTITMILNSPSDGDVADRLFPVVYDELRHQAGSFLRREARGGTLQPTELVHETFIRLFDSESVSFENRKHFFGAAAMAMRRILVDRARAAAAGKRIPKKQLASLEETPEPATNSPHGLIDLDRALDRLESRDRRRARIFELRYFAGLGEEQVAELFEISTRTVTREWGAARRWLMHFMT